MNIKIKDSKKNNVVNNFVLSFIYQSRNFWNSKYDVTLSDYLTPTPEIIKLRDRQIWQQLRQNYYCLVGDNRKQTLSNWGK